MIAKSGLGIKAFRYVFMSGLFLIFSHSLMAIEYADTKPFLKRWPVNYEDNYSPFAYAVAQDWFDIDFSTSADLQAWQHMDLNDPDGRWHTSTIGGWKGSNSWWCAAETHANFNNGYDDFWYKALTTREWVEIPGVEKEEIVLLNFMSSYALESNFIEDSDAMDGINVQVFWKDEWQTLESETYSKKKIKSYMNYEKELLPLGWTGENKVWHNVQFDLSKFCGDKIYLRFTLASDEVFSTKDNGQLFGWRIDDIDISIWDSKGFKKFKQLYYNDGFDGNTNEGGIELELSKLSLLPSASDLWHISPDSQLVCNDGTRYHPNMKNVYYTPKVYISPDITGRLKLDFDVFGSLRDNQAGDDFWLLDVSPNNGQSWYNITDLNRNTTKQKFVSIGQTQSPDNPFSKMYPGLDNLNLRNLGGDWVQFRFSFVSDGDAVISGEDKGLILDNFKLQSIDEQLKPPVGFEVKTTSTEVQLEWLPIQWGIDQYQWDDNLPSSYSNFHYEYGINYTAECGELDSVLLEEVLVYTYFNSDLAGTNTNSLDLNVYLYELDEFGNPSTRIDSLTGVAANLNNLEPTVVKFKKQHYFLNGESFFIGVSNVSPGGVENPTSYVEDIPIGYFPADGKYDYQGILVDKIRNSEVGWVRANRLNYSDPQKTGTRTWSADNAWMKMQDAFSGDINIPCIRVNLVSKDASIQNPNNYVVHYTSGSGVTSINVNPSSSSKILPVPQYYVTYTYWVTAAANTYESAPSRKISKTFYPSAD